MPEATEKTSEELEKRMGGLLEGKNYCFWINPSQDPDIHGGYVPSIVIENEPGHRPLMGNGVGAAPWVWDYELDKAEATCEMANAKRGISPMQALEIMTSSMFPSSRRTVDAGKRNV